jgi:hypothetical protein
LVAARPQPRKCGSSFFFGWWSAGWAVLAGGVGSPDLDQHILPHRAGAVEDTAFHEVQRSRGSEGVVSPGSVVANFM